MKRRNISIIAAVVALMSLGSVNVLSAQDNINEELQLLRGVGPAISGSVKYNDIPREAREFMKKHFKGVKIASMQKEYADSDYDVTFADGTEIEFNAQGQVVEIEAHEKALKQDIVKDILPKAAFDELVRNNVQAAVRKIDVDKTVYEVKFIKKENVRVSEMKFDTNGKLLKSK